MPFSENVLLITLAAANLAAACLCAVPLARRLRETAGSHRHFFWFFAMMLGLYFFECVAFAWGMCTQVLSIAISIEWGILFGLWLNGLAPAKRIIKLMMLISLYGCLPTVSFAVILATFWAINGNGLLNVEQAANFGIPDFIPWPFNTILGFCVALAAGTIILKTAFATGITALIVRKD